MLFFLFIQPIQPLSDSLYATGPANTIAGNRGDINTMFNTSLRTETYKKGDAVTFFMRFLSNDNSDGERNYTAAFQVAVDTYAQLTVPNSVNMIVPKSGAGDAYRKVSVYAQQRFGTGSTSRYLPICDLLPRKIWDRTVGGDWVVQSRTVLIRLRDGKVQSCDWAPTKCIASNQVTIDNICADPCNGGTCKYNITLHIAWTGNDGAGNIMRSYERDVWRFKNAL